MLVGLASPRDASDCAGHALPPSKHHCHGRFVRASLLTFLGHRCMGLLMLNDILWMSLSPREPLFDNWIVSHEAKHLTDGLSAKKLSECYRLPQSPGMRLAFWYWILAEVLNSRYSSWCFWQFCPKVVNPSTGYLGLLVAMQRSRRKIGVPLAQAS